MIIRQLVARIAIAGPHSDEHRLPRKLCKQRPLVTSPL